MEYSGVTQPLCSLQGACHGYAIWLENSALPFGAVVHKSSLVKRLTVQNEGDIGASFKWDLAAMRPDFSIQPSYGYVSPGMHVHFNVTFTPSELSADIRKPLVKCFLEGCDPLALTLTGSCVQAVPQRETHHFESSVRQRDSKAITIANRTNAAWELRPVIEGEFFSGNELLTVDPQSTTSYEVVYAPTAMTGADSAKKHSGSVFFPLPDGTALLYSLMGTANPPKPMGKLMRDVPCKTAYTEVLLVENWLNRPQRFKVIFEQSKPERADASTTIKVRGRNFFSVKNLIQQSFLKDIFKT